MKSARLPKILARAALLVLATAAIAACDGRRETREFLNMPDMHFSPAIKAHEHNPWAADGLMAPVPGTIPVNWQPYTIADVDADTLAQAMENPVPMTPETLALGQKYYGIFCVACHGKTGDGLGTVILRNAGMPRPPHLTDPKITDEWSDGRIFHVLTVGQGNMPGYPRIDAEKRWAIIHYIRALGRAAHPTEEELAELDAFLAANPDIALSFRQQFPDINR